MENTSVKYKMENGKKRCSTIGTTNVVVNVKEF